MKETAGGAILEYKNSKRKKRISHFWSLFFDKERENMRYGWDPQSLWAVENSSPERKRNQRPCISGILPSLFWLGSQELGCCCCLVTKSFLTL